MKKIIYTFAFLMLSGSFWTLCAKSIQEKYISKYAPTAVAEMQRTGVPASITLAQGLLESSAGESPLAKKGNNHFGIKCHKDWTGKKMFQDDDAKGECFRVYASAELSFKDHSDFLRYRDRYKSLFELRSDDYKAWAKGLKKAGYATDPKYAEKLCSTIERYGLQKYDKGIVVPESPIRAEEPVPVSEIPEVAATLAETTSFALSTELKAENGVPFVIASEGQNYKTIAAENGLFLRELLKYNDAAADTPLESGEFVYLQHKKARAARGLDKFIVEEDGTSLRAISQRFAVKLKSLCKMNGCKADRKLNAGDTIRLR